MNRNLIYTILLILTVSIVTSLPVLIGTSLNAEGYSNRKQFLDIDELSDLIKKAKEVGLSDDELRNITIPYEELELGAFIEEAREAGITDEDLMKIIPEGKKQIVVIEYINLIEKLTQLQNQKLKEFLSKKFLTVNDVFKELVVGEPKTIQKLREELVSER